MGGIYVWPTQLENILMHYYALQDRHYGKILTINQRKGLVEELISAYNTLPYIMKRDVLIPAKWQFLKDHAINADQVGSKKYRYEINYRWPPNDGFKDFFDKIVLKPGYEYDRIGGNKGVFLAPIPEGGDLVSFLERALPYYVPETDISNSPAYHRYKVVAEYHGFGPDDRSSVLQGTTAHAFWVNPDDGGGIQVKLPRRIRELGGILSEIRSKI